MEQAPVSDDLSIRRKRPWLDMFRIQILGLLITQVIAVGVTMVYWYGPSLGQWMFFHRPFFYESFLWCQAAAVAGHIIFRQLTKFPGRTSIVYLFTSHVFSYSAMALLTFIIRTDYSRPLVPISYLAAIAWGLFLYVAYLRTQRPSIYVVPGGKIGGIETLREVRATVLTSPSDHYKNVEAVVADLQFDHAPKWEHYLASCVLNSVPVHDVKNLYEDITGRVEINHLSENSFGSVLPSSSYLSIKRLIDFFVCILALPFVGVIVGVAAIITKLESPGPAIFKQVRMGFRGRPFVIYKLRTMRQDHVGKLFTEKGDTRITRLGGVFRKYRIDELPQIVNILKGDMSWIGPRPEAIDLAKRYEEKIPYYVYRHAVRPGITGWAQVGLGYAAEVEAVTVKLQYDFYYIKYFSPWLDLLIVLRTIYTIMTGFGSR